MAAIEMIQQIESVLPIAFAQPRGLKLWWLLKSEFCKSSLRFFIIFSSSIRKATRFSLGRTHRFLFLFFSFCRVFSGVWAGVAAVISDRNDGKAYIALRFSTSPT